MDVRVTSPGKYNWAEWLGGIWAGLISGGATAVTAAVTVIPQDPTDYNLASYRFYVLIFRIFAVGGILGAFAYLKKHPLPEVITITTTETTIRQTAPPAIVKTTVEQTTVEPPK
jgi:hypothetical protein